ncbi:hypothetical protein DdX_13769 [Ditylenchus destructor]|uniref:Uncharacterized protein n=1 Tax=Ditylenchus destructor TaxID=166010 RepID=A0AAD4R2A1_9BILA|nr:hypothetical protein DdX_13769 [Ditylenchus destructor]
MKFIIRERFQGQFKGCIKFLLKSCVIHLALQVIGSGRSGSINLIPVPHSQKPQDQAIRVVKAFQAGRREPSLTGPSAARLREISRQLKQQSESEQRAMTRSRTNSQNPPTNDAISSV